MGGAIKLGTDIGLSGTFTHNTCIGAAAQHQLQGINQNRFTCPGLARQHGKACVQIQIQLLHDDKVTQGDAFERHGQ